MNNKELESFLQEKQQMINYLFDSLKRDVNLDFKESIQPRLRTLTNIALDVNSRMENFVQKGIKGKSRDNVD